MLATPTAATSAPPFPALHALFAGCAAQPRHPVWHIRAFYAARARRFTGRRALDESKRDLYHLLATDGSDQWDRPDGGAR